MRAILFHKFGKSDVLQLGELPTPVPSPTEVLIALEYTAVNPVDLKIREGKLTGRMPHNFPIIPGWDAAGVIAAIGNKVTNLKVGDQVYAYCRKPTIQWGTYADDVTFVAIHVALKPKKLSFAQAAAIPLVGLTAWQAVFDAGRLKSGEQILIHAGAGGVGGMAIQFAKEAGAKVITTCRSQHEDYVRQLGADQVIDYTQEDFVEKVRAKFPHGIDLVIDTVGGDTFTKSIQLLKAGGRLVSLLEKMSGEEAAQHAIQATYLFVEPNGHQLKQIADLIDSDKVRAPKIEEFTLEKAAEAQDKLQNGHIEGKIVLKIGNLL
jgi:NADPH:quinone reductase-like Zn-dependent oxidoreductase